MKKRHLLLLVVFSVLFIQSKSINIYKHQMLGSEADELNKLAEALNISGTGWPVSTEVSDKYLNIEGVVPVVVETTFDKLVPNESNPQIMDSIFIQKYKVQYLSISSNGYTGSIPDLTFDELTSFQLGYNQVSGNIPTLNCPKLQTLSLANNKLTGEIPNFNFPELTHLYLYSNELTGTIPDFNLPRLEALNLSNNSFSGELILFTGMPSLKNMDVSYNELTSINKYFGFPNLEYLDVSNNKFSGELPSINCPKLKLLDLSNYKNYSTPYKFSGSIPDDMVLTECETFRINHNDLTGTLPLLNMPKVRTIDISFNNLSGPLPSFKDYISLVTLNAFYNKFSGNIPAFNLPDLQTLDLTYNEFSGPIPAINCPKLKILHIDRNSLTGSIPNLNLPLLEELDLSSNKLNGSIPALSLPRLEILDLAANELTDSIPHFSLPSLEYLELQHNQLSGSIPAFQMPSLYRLNLSNNNLSGSIPPMSFPDLDELTLNDNQLTGAIPALILPEVDEINLTNNRLTGEIPQMNMPKLRYLYLNNNQLEGAFNNTGLPRLYSVFMEGNRLTGLSQIKAASPDIRGLNVRRNRLTFEDIEYNTGIVNFYYEEQDSVDHQEVVDGNKVTLKIRTGGSANQYQWMKSLNGQDFSAIENGNSDSIVVNLEANVKYTCKITNPLADKLTLWSRPAAPSSCLAVGLLEFCVEEGTWESGEDNELTTNGKVAINELLIFEGNITVDTVKLSVKADGEFYINEIPLPGGSSGRYSFCQGEYELSLLGEEGAITSFLDSKFEQTGQLFGIDLKLSRLELVGGRSATGIQMDCKIGVPGISGSCGEEGDDKTEFELSGLTFSTSGISLNGIEVTDLGLLIDGYCLKNLVFNYDSEKDILISGAHVALPFGEIGGGFKMAQGYLDSIAWHLEAAKPPFVLGTTTIGIKGFFGHISNITEPAIEIELGGIFTDITSENFYLINASGKTIWPSFFEVKGEGQFLKPPLIDKPYQVKGTVAMSYDHPLEMFAIDFSDGGIGTSDGETWLISGEGKLKLSTRMEPPALAGDITGNLSLPKFSDKFPYDWLNSMFSFPVTASSNASFVWGKSHVMFGSALFETATRGPYNLRYVIDLKKSYGEDGFLYFETQVETKSARLKSGSTTHTLTENFTISEEADFAVISITSPTAAPASSLINPQGKSYTAASIPDKIDYTVSDDGKKAFWTLTSPAQGNWQVVLDNPASDDSIRWFVQSKIPELELSMQQAEQNVTITWNPAGFNASDSIIILLDDNNSGFDGFAVAFGAASAGTLSFEMSELLSACSYHLFAQVVGDSYLTQAYADGTVSNPKSILTAPVILSANYFPETGQTAIYYENSDDPEVTGYILEVTSSSGQDSTYAIVNTRSSVINLTIENFEDKAVKMTSFNANGLKGCPSESKQITTSVDDIPFGEPARQQLLFYPNPTTGRGTIEFILEKDTHCEILISDFYGRIIARPVSESRKAGHYSEEWDFENVANGIYLIILRCEQEVQSGKVILNR